MRGDARMITAVFAPSQGLLIFFRANFPKAVVKFAPAKTLWKNTIGDDRLYFFNVGKLRSGAERNGPSLETWSQRSQSDLMHPFDGPGALKALLYCHYITLTLNTLVSRYSSVSSTLRFRY